MSNVNMGSTNSASSVMSATQFSANDVSPDQALAYCEFQLNGLDGELATQMNSQDLQLAQREAVENAQDALENFGTTGPQTPQQFQTCEAAISQAAASLPPGDPVAAQLTQFGQQIATQYGYTAPQALSPAESATLDQIPLLTSNSNGSVTPQFGGIFLTGNQAALVALNNGSLSNAPANNDWQGTTDTLGTMANGIQSNAAIQMLSVQNLASQQQQAVEMASGIMSTENQTLQDIAKNIGG
jgi:hypothetical protein